MLLYYIGVLCRGGGLGVTTSDRCYARQQGTGHGGGVGSRVLGYSNHGGAGVGVLVSYVQAT